MQKLFRCLSFAVAFTGAAVVATAGELTVKVADGRATVIAKDVPVRQILAEWARVGNTKIVNAEKLVGAPVTLELIDVPEKEALDILLRSAAGYMAAPRPVALAGASQFDRVLILATSRPPAASVSSPPQPFNRPVIQQMPPQPPPDDDDGEPGDQGPMPPGAFPPGAMPPGAMPPGAMPPGAQAPGFPPAPPGAQPAPPGAQPMNQPMVAPRPGMLPQQPTPGQPNPYVTRPGQPGRPGSESIEQEG